MCVRDEQAVSDDVRLGFRVATGTEEWVDGFGVHWVGGANAVGGATRGEDTTTVAEDSNTPRFVEGEPVLDAVAEVLEANLEPGTGRVSGCCTWQEARRPPIDTPSRSWQSPW